jgi:hypothetical protein
MAVRDWWRIMPDAPLTPQKLLERLFSPLYPAAAGSRDERAEPCPPGRDGGADALRAIDDAAGRFARLAPQVLQIEDLDLDLSDASVRRLGQTLTEARRDRLAALRGPDGAPLLTHLVVHGTLYVGACAVKNHGARWKVRSPLWESAILVDSPLGQAELSIFSWWLRALSDGEMGRGTLAERYRMYVEIPRTDPAQIPGIAGARRLGAIPRLAKVRYDTLHRHLRAHAPELTDLGADFPSAERLAEMRFRWLDFTWLGEGRLLLIHGPAEHGVHLFWLDGAGFSKAAFFPSDFGGGGPNPPYSLVLDGELIRVVFSVAGREVEHLMLFWGP